MEGSTRFKVSSLTSTQKLAAAIAGSLAGSDEVELLAVGAAAVNTAVKAVASAERLINEQDGAEDAPRKTLTVHPAFAPVAIEDATYWALLMTVSKM